VDVVVARIKFGLAGIVGSGVGGTAVGGTSVGTTGGSAGVDVAVAQAFSATANTTIKLRNRFRRLILFSKDD
jgi:hypothetical protein